MKTRLSIFCFALGLWLALGGPAAAQNPLTGRPVNPAYNPYTGTGAGRGPNPLTGMPAAAPPNPLTGKMSKVPAAYNPWTGPGTPTPPPTAVLKKVPIRGKAGPGFEALDEAILAIMDHHGLPGAGLAIAKDGKLVYAKGFGWANLDSDIEIDPFTVFGLASCSKPITALAILALIEQGKLGLDDFAFDYLKHIKAPPGSRVDPRISKITIRQLLNHSGGWDRNKSGDPMNQSPQIARLLGAPLPLNEDQFLSFILSRPLDFEPGKEMQYSNTGYITLGRIVEKVSGKSYEEFIKENILRPAGVKRAYVNEGTGRYKAGEACSYLAGTTMMLPPMDLRLVKAAGGWTTSAVDLVRILTALDGTRGKGLFKEATFKQMLALPPAPLTKRKDGTHPGLGWPTTYLGPKGTFGYFHDGQFHGQRTFIKRNEKGVNWALLFNVTMQPDQIDAGLLREAVEDIRRRVDAIGTYPDIDLFTEY